MSAHTLVALHAHPDDESLLTGGTLALAAAAGHRVVVVTATDGSLGLTSRRYAAADLGAIRLGELREAARLLGAARVEWLGYADSGLGPRDRPALAAPARFTDVPVAEAAGRLAAILAEEGATVLLSYDVNGGYGHPDHRRVHEVGRAAAAMVGTARLLEVQVSARVARLMAPRGTPLVPVPAPTTVVDVREVLTIKVAAMRAHRSQLVSDGPVPRNIDLLTRLPGAVLARAIGRERYAGALAVAAGAPGGAAAPAGDVFAGLPDAR